eukprot:scaffold4756_cov116-Isochrysis_galbana.AAC.8
MHACTRGRDGRRAGGGSAFKALVTAVSPFPFLCPVVLSPSGRLPSRPRITPAVKDLRIA